jgi:hypothetical protein
MTRPKHLGGLGFRDIELFNLSLLARQTWRLLHTPDSLSAHILKVVYFPQSTILKAELGSHPSQICGQYLMVVRFYRKDSSDELEMAD